MEVNKVYLGDSLKVMKNIPDNSIDCVITDPPYGINEGGSSNKSRSKLAIAKYYHDYGDDKTPNKIYFDEIFRISKNQIIFGANHFITKMPYNSSCWIVWDKDNGKTDFADCELAYTSFKSAVRIIKWRWQGMLQGDMKNKEYREHPNQKPIPIMKWILSNYTKENDLILDPFMGSGTTCVACKLLDRRYIGIEKDEHYFKIAEQRIKDTLVNKRLFKEQI